MHDSAKVRTSVRRQVTRGLFGRHQPSVAMSVVTLNVHSESTIQSKVMRLTRWTFRGLYCSSVMVPENIVEMFSPQNCYLYSIKQCVSLGVNVKVKKRL